MDKLCGVESSRRLIQGNEFGTFKIYKYENLPQSPLVTFSSGDYFRKKGNPDILFISVVPPGSHKAIGSILAELYEEVEFNPEILSHGQSTKSLQPLSARGNLSSFYFKTPWMYNDDDIEKEYLQAVPISANERKYLIKFGVEALEDYFNYHSVRIFLFWRPDSMDGFDDNEMEKAYQEVSSRGSRIISGDYDEVFHYCNSLGEFDINVFFNKKSNSQKTLTCDFYTKLFPQNFVFNAMMVSEIGTDIDQQANLLATASTYFWRNPELFRHGSVLEVPGPVHPGSEIKAFYVTRPLFFNDTKICQKYLWVIPVTDAEVNRFNQYGVRALEKNLWKYNVNLFDFKRKSSV